MIATKEGVSLAGTHPALWALAPAIYAVTVLTMGRRPIVTSATRPPGDRPSYHSAGLAWDLRANDVDDATAQTYASRLRTVLAPFGVDVVGPYPRAEGGHVHVEVDARKLAARAGVAALAVLVLAML